MNTLIIINLVIILLLLFIWWDLLAIYHELKEDINHNKKIILNTENSKTNEDR